MIRGRIPAFCLLFLLAASPAAGVVCEMTCAEPASGERRVPAGLSDGSAACHSSATPDRDTPSVRLLPAAAGHCEHGSDYEAIAAERAQPPDSRGHGLAVIAASAILSCGGSQDLHDGAFRDSPQGLRIGFGLPIRV